MPAVIHHYDPFLLAPGGIGVTQDKDKEGPQFSVNGGKYFFMKQTSPAVPEISSGDEVWVVNEGVSNTYWVMPSNELGATQDSLRAGRFRLLHGAGRPGPLEYGDTVLMQSVASLQWVGVTSTGQELRGHPDIGSASAVHLLELGTPTLAPPVSVESDWCITVYSFSDFPKREDFHGTHDAAYQRKEKIRAGTFDYAGDNIKLGHC